MRILHNTSLKHKQTLVIMGTAALALLLACAAFVIYDGVISRRELVRNLSSSADIVGGNSTAALDFNDTKVAEETLGVLKASPNITRAWIFTKEGGVFATYQREGRTKSAPPVLQAAGHEFTEDGLLRVFRMIEHQGETLGVVMLESDLKQLEAQRNQYFAITGAVLACSLLLALVLSSRLQRVVSEPILQLVETTRSVARDRNYSLRAVKRSEDELGHLIDHFNEMLGQIQARDSALQQAHDELERRVEHRTRELRESQALYHSLVDNLPVFIYRKDREGRYTFANRLFCERKDQPLEEIIGKSDFDYSPRPLAEKYRADDARVMATGGNYEAVEEYRLPDGSQAYIQIIKVPIRDAQGEIIGTQGMYLDVTARRRAEEDLAYERSLFNTLLDSLPESIYFKDRESRFIKCSRSLAGYLGLQDATEVRGKTDFDFFTEEHARPAYEAEQEIIRTGLPVIGLVEKEIWRDGRVTWARTTKMPLRDKSGAIVGTFGVSSNITTLMEAEQSLRDSELRFHAVWENSADAFRLTDAEGRIVSVNESFCRLVNKRRDELEGQPLTVCYAEGTSPAESLHKHVERFARRNIAQRQERKVTFHDGREVHLETTNSFLELPDRPALLLSLFRDITERKQAEEKLTEAHREMVTLSRAAGMAEVATGVLHNVGNVLNSVNVSTSLVADTVRKSKVNSLAKAMKLFQDHRAELGHYLTNDEKGRQLPGYLQKLSEHLADEQAAILKELAGLAKNIDHIKDIVSMQQSYAKVSGVVEIMPVAELVEDALRMNAAALARHDVRVVREFDAVPPLPVDKHKVLQILVNLIRNAKYACDEAGRDEKQLTVRIAGNGNGCVKIVVSDNGVGIPPENLTRIFSHGFTTRKEGHGFGLHSGALAAREMGGSLSVHSDGPGLGASFTLELPAKN
ncbi:MAG: PAS domain S-box protein [Verrucomicrobiota bacterium]